MLRRTQASPGRSALSSRPSKRRRTRGQSLVEFALVLPILLFLTLIALDFGRVYLGYINLQNMARIAANFAGNNPSAWDGVSKPGDAKLKKQYENQILADAQAINCELIDTNADGDIDADDFTPTFTDRTGNGYATDAGDTGEVQIGCRFAVITPGIASVVGGSVQVAGASRFPVKNGMIASGPGTVGDPPNAAFSGNGVITSASSPAALSGVAPFDVEFRDTSGGNPTQWTWTFPDTNPDTIVNVQDPLNHTFPLPVFPDPGVYIVTMKAENLWGSSTAQMTITVVDASDVNFHADDTTPAPGQLVQFTDDSTAGATGWVWTFGVDEGSSTEQNPTHTYAYSGTYTVSLQVTYPSPTGVITETKTGYISVVAGTCRVPDLLGQHFNDAEAIFQGPPYNFTGVVIRKVGPKTNGNFTITEQNLVGNSYAPCDSDILVGRP
jgi:PKD repeat protein/Flp pilus assembly protein TadG